MASKKNGDVHYFSVSPEFEQVLEEEIKGYHAKLRGCPFNPNQTINWKNGYNQPKLTVKQLRYMFR